MGVSVIVMRVGFVHGVRVYRLCSLPAGQRNGSVVEGFDGRWTE